MPPIRMRVSHCTQYQRCEYFDIEPPKKWTDLNRGEQRVVYQRTASPCLHLTPPPFICVQPLDSVVKDVLLFSRKLPDALPILRRLDREVQSALEEDF